jgi:hypothetical protein
MKEVLSSSETTVLTRVTLRNSPEDDIVHSHRRENLKSYVCLGYVVRYAPDVDHAPWESVLLEMLQYKTPGFFMN